jgi:hypothetical protein
VEETVKTGYAFDSRQRLMQAARDAREDFTRQPAKRFLRLAQNLHQARRVIVMARENLVDGFNGIAGILDRHGKSFIHCRNDPIDSL